MSCRADTPAMLHYETLLGSLYNTPPCWSIYVCGLVFQHLLDQVRFPHFPHYQSPFWRLLSHQRHKVVDFRGTHPASQSSSNQLITPANFCTRAARKYRFDVMHLQGGIEGVQENNRKKAQVVYDAIAGSDGFYNSPVDVGSRSPCHLPCCICSATVFRAQGTQ